MDVDDGYELQTILAQQLNLLPEANSTDADLDLAFKLQIQEAMAASLSHQPSTSSNSPLKFDLMETDRVVSGPGLGHLLEEQLSRFEQERRDREYVEAEMRRMRDDLDRRIHDQAFARQLLAVPEDEWQKTGNHIHRPYGEGSSSSSSSAEGKEPAVPKNVEESFRLYFKGVVSEETVGGMKKKLAGVGVAICDASDIPVFELRKPLIDDFETSSDVVAVKALLEGLNAAVTLGIKRINIVCYDNSLYLYVIKKQLPNQTNFRAVVDQVTLLQKKFSVCSVSLVAGNDIKFAFKLARDAIISQLSMPAEGSRGKNLIETCIICYEDTDVGQMFSVDGCLHRYCFSCMKQYVEVKLHQGRLPKCPHDGCELDIKIGSCKKFLPSELFELMSQHIKEASIPVNEKLYCPYPSCSAVMSKVEVQGYVVNSFPGTEQSGVRKCTKCAGLFCINCKVPWHTNRTCYDYKRSNPHPSAEEAKLKSLAMMKRWRQCLRCNQMVELAEGCYHIYCRCGYEFCYICGSEWKNKKATCTCPIWDERNIIYDAGNRGQV